MPDLWVESASMARAAYGLRAAALDLDEAAVAFRGASWDLSALGPLGSAAEVTRTVSDAMARVAEAVDALCAEWSEQARALDLAGGILDELDRRLAARAAEPAG